jgi:hypothetical protein
LVLAWRARERGAFGVLPAQTIFLLFTTVAVLYYPDLVHLAFISSVLLVVAVETVEWGLGRLEAIAPMPLLGMVIALPLAVFSLLQMAGTHERLHAKFHITQETEFGPVDFGSEEYWRLFLEVRAELDASAGRALFCYPVFTSLYLTTDAQNPTRHVLMFPNYLPQAQFDEVFEILDARRVRSIVIVPKLIDPKTDPMLAYVRRNYRCADGSRHCWLYRRRE